MPVIGLEPSCTAVLRGESAELLPDDADARLVASATSTLAEFLDGDDRWRAPDLSVVDVVAQPHCHHHGFMGWSPDATLLKGAGANLQQLGGCCGLAGNFGVELGHYEVSVAVAEKHLLLAMDAVLLADGFSCRTQTPISPSVEASISPSCWTTRRRGAKPERRASETGLPATEAVQADSRSSLMRAACSREGP